ncbi:hypothetical protein [Akkermansia glycaniphila]|uniref:Uncharacterized protein n=1 Tax=Akkermansia glycaniphila TaxID=1679444 RepID=A0A1H6MKF0_9BACT|nr:hypothetical protein [Akkermansia glycaniphila]SEH99686.1 Hypothetical protein PYTT_2420 [Akkermansia glycaniphila]
MDPQNNDENKGGAPLLNGNGAGGAGGGGSAAWVNADGSFVDGWHNQFGEEYAGLGKFKSAADLAKSYRHLESKQPHVPGEGATPEEVARWRGLAGVPENADGYGLKKPDNLPAGVEWNDEQVKVLADVAHQHHVPKAALQAMLDKQVELERVAAEKQVAEQAAEQEKRVNELKGSWGNEFAAKMQSAGQAWSQMAGRLGLDENSDEAMALRNNTAFVKIMHHVAQFMQDDGRKSIGTPGSQGGGAIGKERAMRIITDESDPLHDDYIKGEPGVTALVRAGLVS